MQFDFSITSSLFSFDIVAESENITINFLGDKQIVNDIPFKVTAFCSFFLVVVFRYCGFIGGGGKIEREKKKERSLKQPALAAIRCSFSPIFIQILSSTLSPLCIFLKCPLARIIVAPPHPLFFYESDSLLFERGKFGGPLRRRGTLVSSGRAICYTCRCLPPQNKMGNDELTEFSRILCCCWLTLIHLRPFIFAWFEKEMIRKFSNIVYRGMGWVRR